MQKSIISLVMLTVSSCVNAIEIPVTYDAYGAVVFGMTVQEAENVLMETVTDLKGDGLASDTLMNRACLFVKFPSLPAAEFKVNFGVIKRVDTKVYHPTILNINGLASLEEIKAQHPSVNVMAHKYIENAYYLKFLNTTKSNGIVYDYYDNKVQLIRAGVTPDVFHVERCG